MANILSVNGNLDQALRELGHTVHSVRLTKSGTYSAEELVAQCPFAPDIFLHKEHLSITIFFFDVHALPCRTAFWGIDSHLRYWWQMFYAALFDVFFTPHLAFLQKLNDEWLPRHSHRLAEAAKHHAFIPHAKREHSINFVGRLSGTRPERVRLCKLLQDRYGIAHRDNMFYSDMLTLYTQTRIIPNESIAKEVNFRLLEGAGCGCTVISPNIGEDQNVLFEPEREILIYENLEELASLLDRHANNISLTEKLGRRAWIRVQKEHLPQHRAQALLLALQEFAPITSRALSHGLPHRRKPDDAQYMNEMSIFALALMHIFDVLTVHNFSAFLHSLQKTPSLFLLTQLFSTLKDCTQGTITAQEGKDRIYILLEEVNTCLMGGNCPSTFKKMLAVAAGGASLKFHDAPRGNFYLHLYEKIQHPEKTFSAKSSLMGAQNTLDVALNWVFILKRDQKQCFCGHNYVSGCCRTAFDFVSLCQELAPLDMRWFAAISSLDQVLANYPLEAQGWVKKAVAGC